jgi:glycosyltransferase involved in cell wall biosynthesis
MKVTKQIKKDKFTELLKLIQNNFGFPQYYEEMVVYLSGNDLNIKIAVKGSKGMNLVYRNKLGKQISELHLGSNEIKNALAILKDIASDSGYISISPVFEFTIGNSSICLINNSLIGPIITMIDYSPSGKELSMFDDFLLENREVDQSSFNLEKIIDFDISERGILNEKIISYIERNGIYLNRNRKTTYKDVLKSKTNDYSGYTNIFSAVTGYDLLSKQPLSKDSLPDLSSIAVSIIIPCYNTENTIAKILSAIKYQCLEINVKTLEVIIVDDGSRRPISNFVSTENYSFALQIIRLEKNRGLSNARNVGVTVSKGDVLIFIDSDILLEQNYIKEHLVRNLIIPNGVFVSFKENVEQNDARISEEQINNGLKMPNYSKDLRIYKLVRKNAIGSYEVVNDVEVEILESTNYFKSFSGSRVFGVYDLSCMVVGHNFSARKETIIQSSPFTHGITGWGMEDVYFGLKLINNGNFIVPVLSTGVYHINHSPRSGSDERKINEYRRNTEVVDKILDTEIQEGIEPDDLFLNFLEKN